MGLTVNVEHALCLANIFARRGASIALMVAVEAQFYCEIPIMTLKKYRWSSCENTVSVDAVETISVYSALLLGTVNE
jgi:hypothetical protein